MARTVAAVGRVAVVLADQPPVGVPCRLRTDRSRRISVVRFVNMQTVSMHQTPFDVRKRMASVAVDTAGAGGAGHRIRIPFLDVDIAVSILQRLYAETRSTEFRW